MDKAERRMKIAKQMSSKLLPILQKKNISDAKLAKDIGLDRSSVSKYVSGKQVPRLDTFLAICEYLKVQPEVFLNESPQNYEKEEKSDEEKTIESLYFLIKNEIIVSVYSHGYDNLDWKGKVLVGKRSILGKIFDECLRYVHSDLTKETDICTLIVQKYSSELKKENAHSKKQR